MSGVLRICTAGSVDDGKSTLLGRLLYESRGVYEDQLRSVEAASTHRGAGPIDFSLFTDGLKAEREQGITIDVAYRYFATRRRTFILADTPGHEQYTRNMATGASTADVAILLVDARRGIQPQTHRHVAIARLLGIRDLVLAVNKIDLVDYDQRVFDDIVAGIEAIGDGARWQAIPVSALLGDNVTARSTRTPWYDGPPLLEHLERVDVERRVIHSPFRFPVQLVLRPDEAFRGYAGRVASGVVAVGDAVTAWPVGRATTVRRIVTRDGDLATAVAGASVTLTLADDLDVSRGDVLAADGAAYHPAVTNHFDAHVVWMDERPLRAGRPYLLKHTTRIVAAEVDRPLQLNEIGSVTVTTSRPLILDPYPINRVMGSFILIDADSHFTAGAGMIIAPAQVRASGIARRVANAYRDGAERIAAVARAAASEEAAVDAVRQALEEMLR